MRALIDPRLLVMAVFVAAFFAFAGSLSAEPAPAEKVSASAIPLMDVAPPGRCSRCSVSEPGGGAITWTPAVLLLLGWGWFRRR